MKILISEIELKTNKGENTYLNITDDLKKFVSESNIKTGQCTIISPHTTCSVFFEEFVHDMIGEKDFLQVDLDNILEKMVPNRNEFDYNYPGVEHFNDVKSWKNSEDYLPNDDISDLYNGEGHLKSTIIGQNVVIPIENGSISLGKTAYVYFVDFDTTRERNRKCKFILIGEEYGSIK